MSGAASPAGWPWAPPAAEIVYLHGFRSSPQSVKANRVAAAVAALPVGVRPRLFIPALFHDPAVAMAAVTAHVDRGHAWRAATDVAFVGSSLGGFYATWLAERYGSRAILVNPAVRPDEDLAPYLGPQTNLYTGETFVVTPAHFATLASMRIRQVTRPERYLLLVQSGDEVLDWREAVAHYAGAWQHVEGGGDHAFRDFGRVVPTLLRFAGVPADP